MDLREFSKGGPGAFQYVPPRSFELAGQTFELQMDDGYDMVLSFDKKTLNWNYVNKEPSQPVTDDYDCMKADDTTYFISLMLHDKDFEHRESWIFVLDLEQHLVTHLRNPVGENPRWPLLINSHFVFGAIKQDGVEYKSYPRHGFTDDMIGNVVQWQYSPEMATVHAYYASDFYRITYPRDQARSKEAIEQAESMNAMVNSLPSSDEPAHYVRIKKGLYLVTVTEQNMEKLLGSAMGFRSDTLTFLDNYNTCYDIGRGFGTMTTKNPDTGEETNANINVLIGAYARIIDTTKDEFWTKFTGDPNPYLVPNN